MKILTFDTSNQFCSVAVSMNDIVVSSHHFAPKQQAQLILPVIKDTLLKANCSLDAIDIIAFTNGPGSFTGIRIGVCVAQALALPTQKKVIPISSLEALAQTARQKYKQKLFAVGIDARMNQIYFGLYESTEKETIGSKQSDVLCSLQDIIIDPKLIRKTVALGDAWVRYETEINQNFKSFPEYDPSINIHAESLIPLAKEKLEKGEWIFADAVRPTYLR